MLKKFSLLPLLVLLMTVLFPAFPQTSPFRKFTAADGLPENRVMHMYEDSYGFLWCFSRNGISRTDGREVISFTFENKQQGIAPYMITEDDSGSIWITTKDGLAVFDGKNFVPYQLPADRSYPEIHYELANYAPGSFYLVAKDSTGMNCLVSFSEGSYKTVELSDTLFDHGTVSSLTYSRRYGGLYFNLDLEAHMLRNDTIYDVDLPKGLAYMESGDELYASIADSCTYRIMGNGTQAEIISEQEYIEYFNMPRPGNDRYDSYIIVPGLLHSDTIHWHGGFINGVLRDSRDNVWMAGEEGLFLLLSEEIRIFGPDEAPASDIWSVVEDWEGYAWFTSMKGTIYRYRDEVFEDMGHLLPEGVTNFTLGTRVMPGGGIWFTTYNGIIEWDGNGFRWLDLDDGQVESIYADTLNGSIVFGTSSGLKVLNGDTLVNFHEMGPSGFGYARDICKGAGSTLVIASHKAFYYFKEGEFAILPDIAGLHNNPYAVETDLQGNTWFGSDGGLFFQKAGTDKVIPALAPAENKPVRAIAVTSPGMVIAGRTGDFITINPADTRGAGPFSYKLYNGENGFTASGCRQGGITAGADGNIWITGNDGVIKFIPGTIDREQKPPRFYITTIEGLDRKGNWSERGNHSPYIRPRQNDIILSPGESNIRISLVGLESSSAGRIVYSYRIRGSKSEWSEPVTDRTLFIPGLKRGRQTIEIKATHSLYRSASSIRKVDVRLQPMLRQRPAFMFTLAFVLLGAGYYGGLVVLRARERRISEKTRLVREQYRLQMGNFTQQFDPHFTFNVLSSLSTFYMTGRQEEADEYLHKFAGLLRTVIEEDDFLRTLEMELKFISDYCEMQKLKLGDRFSFSIKVDDPRHLKTKVPRMMIHNFVENSIKWGLNPSRKGGEVIIEVSGNGSTEITITDNGIGREAASRMSIKGTGKGYRVTRSLINLLNSFNSNKISLKVDDLHDADGTATGTMVKIIIPASFDYFL